jgi:hypothetical protein
VPEAPWWSPLRARSRAARARAQRAGASGAKVTTRAGPGWKPSLRAQPREAQATHRTTRPALPEKPTQGEASDPEVTPRPGPGRKPSTRSTPIPPADLAQWPPTRPVATYAPSGQL